VRRRRPARRPSENSDALLAALIAGELRPGEVYSAPGLGLLALAGNAHLVEVVRDLRRRSRLYGLTALAEQGRRAARPRPRAVHAVMTRHLGHVRGLWAAP
jgi:DNA-binding GntR family transcriptional regulator